SFSRDWSSDVCSSDLGLWFDSAFAPRAVLLPEAEPAQGPGRYPPRGRRGRARWLGFGSAFAPWAVLLHKPEPAQDPGRYPPRVRRGRRARWLGFGSAFAPWAVLLHETG